MTEKPTTKIMIDENGALHLERAGKLKPQFCKDTGFQRPCWDGCPCFGNPKEDFDYDEDTGAILSKTVIIALCEEFWECPIDQFEDRRKPATTEIQPEIPKVSV